MQEFNINTEHEIKPKLGDTMTVLVYFKASPKCMKFDDVEELHYLYNKEREEDMSNHFNDYQLRYNVAIERTSSGGTYAFEDISQILVMENNYPNSKVRMYYSSSDSYLKVA